MGGVCIDFWGIGIAGGVCLIPPPAATPPTGGDESVWIRIMLAPCYGKDEGKKNTSSLRYLFLGIPREENPGDRVSIEAFSDVRGVIANFHLYNSGRERVLR